MCRSPSLMTWAKAVFPMEFPDTYGYSAEARLLIYFNDRCYFYGADRFIWWAASAGSHACFFKALDDMRASPVPHSEHTFLGPSPSSRERRKVVAARLARGGHLDILRQLHVEGWIEGGKEVLLISYHICSNAAKGGHLNVLQWARENYWKLGSLNEDTCG